MAQVIHSGPHTWFSAAGLAPGTEHSWALGPDENVILSTWSATAHPLLPLDRDRRLSVTRIDSVGRPSGGGEFPPQARFVTFTVRNVGTTPVTGYRIWFTQIRA